MTLRTTASSARRRRVFRSWLVLVLVAGIAGAAPAPAATAKTKAPPKAAPQEGDAAVLGVLRKDLPPAPAGFDWQLFKNALFVKPKGWHEQRVNVTGASTPTFVYAASGEAFSAAKQFETGLTINIFEGGQRIRGIPASKLVALYLAPFIEAHQQSDVQLFEQKQQGDFLQVTFRYRDAPPGQKPAIVHKSILANDKADSLHVFTFESPEDTFAANWEKFGTPILSKVKVLPNLPIQ